MPYLFYTPYIQQLSKFWHQGFEAQIIGRKGVGGKGKENEERTKKREEKKDKWVKVRGGRGRVEGGDGERKELDVIETNVIVTTV